MPRSPGPKVSRPCKRGLHVIPAGVIGCNPCKREAMRLARERAGGKIPPKGNLPAYARVPFPPADVLDGAACTPELAYLFDPAGERVNATISRADRDRQASAKAVCARCLVRAECLADGVANRRDGVWGGQVLRAGVVQVVRSVPDSTAC